MPGCPPARQLPACPALPRAAPPPINPLLPHSPPLSPVRLRHYAQPVFIPLFKLYQIYGPVFKLSFGPKQFVIVSDPEMTKHVSTAQCRACRASHIGCAWPARAGCKAPPAPPLLCRRRRRWLLAMPTPASHAPPQILLHNAANYSKGLLSEILDFVMGQGLIPADGEVWKVRRR